MSNQMANARLLPQWLYEQSDTKKYPLGNTFEMQDGRTYAYVKNGATAIGAGLAVTAISTVTTHEDTVTVAHPVGTKTVVVTDAACALNIYEDGYLVVSQGSGMGEIYKIKSNTSSNGTTATVSLYDGLATLWNTSTTDIDLWANPFNGVVLCPEDAQQAPQGITVIPLTASYYGWVQTSGLGAVILDRDAAAGAEADEKIVYCSTATSGWGILRAAPSAGSNYAGYHKIGVLIAEADIVTGTANLVNISLA